MYYNFIKQAKEISEIMNLVDSKYNCTLRTMLDEIMFHFMEEHKVPFEKQEEFLTVMFYDEPTLVKEYKTRKINK
ncbi:MAG: hypothetical protein RR744_08310 [Cellulosilyticaceae bacterium]